MRKSFIFIILVLIINSPIYAQEYVKVTFRHYPTNENVVRAFVPGTFNNWGPNTDGVIAPSAPSLMTYVDSLECYIKQIRLTVGSTHNYKFHEHYNPSGTSWEWFTDPLNPDINYADNNNSIINITKVMIFEVLPRDGAVVTDSQPEIVAGVFTTENDSILLPQSTIFLDDSLIATFENNFFADLSVLKLNLPELINGSHTIAINVQTKNGESRSQTINFTYQGGVPPIEELPAGIDDGVNVVDDSTVTFVLFAPYYKKFVYLLGDFNDWQVDQKYFMKMTPDRKRYWLTVSGLDAKQEYRFQYFVDGTIRLADPYTEKVLDPWNDQYISSATYPDLIPYPSGKTSEIVSTFRIEPETYQWEIPHFNRPELKDLIIYELLIRDFIAEHDYKTLIDTLDYFERLGINAIELLPVNEFEGNNSWGYNPAFYFAPDKYYGPKNDLKRFIDECHKRGIAVILDIVLNHSFGQSPLVRLFADGNYGPPSSNNPWYNVNAPHPYSVGYDFNHEQYNTKVFVDSVTTFWISEYNVDGYRFDLSKGFTQKYSDNDVGLWSAYDASRIALLKRIADHIWSVDSTFYVILEHFADNTEEKELSDYGMLLWGNLNGAYGQSAMGWLEDSQRSSDLSWGYFKRRGWTNPNLITYMESHDEPWLMYKNLRYGRSYGNYNIKELRTALNRIKLCAAFFLTIPGPKMMWQFGELGYDQYLPASGGDRTAPKPILWNYYHQTERKSLYETYAALIKLRKDYEVFRDPDALVTMRVGHGQYDRRINISNDSMNVTIIGNFHVQPLDVTPYFQKTGAWYDYFTGDTIHVSDTRAPISLLPGEFHIYTDVKLTQPVFTTKVAVNTTATIKEFSLKQNYPNPFNPTTTIQYQLPATADVKLEIYNLQGQKIRTLVRQEQMKGSYRIVWDGLTDTGEKTASGLYIYHLQAGECVRSRKMLLIK